MMKRKILLVLWLCVVVGALHAEELAWESDYDKALETAKTKQKPVLIDFSAAWCGPCRLMQMTTFADADVQDDLADYILVKVDFDQNVALVGKYGVQAIPACFVLNQFGEKVSTQVGYAAPGEFRSWLASHYDAAMATVSKNQTVIDRMQTLGRALELPDASARDSAAATLMEIYCAKNADDDGNGAKLAEQALREFVQRHPAMALSYLSDRRLAVRILFTTLLAEKIGADFQFDPWDNARARTSAIAAWSMKLNPPR